MQPATPKSTFYDLILPRVELLGALATALGLGLLLGYGRPSTALPVGLLTLATAFFLRAFRPAAVPAATEPGPAYVPVTQPAAPTGHLALVADKIQGIASATALVGVLFKLLLWPGADVLLLVGLLTLVPVAGYLAATGRLMWQPALALTLALAVKLAFAPLMHFAYRDDPTLAGRILYQQAHPRDPAARAEVQQRLRARRQRR